jgi:hydroxymethylglutaryl-CoA lyase
MDRLTRHTPQPWVLLLGYSRFSTARELFTMSVSLPPQVTLVDVGARDGLQNEKQNVDTAHKVELVQRLMAAGLREIEVTSFVSPKWVPQMSDNTAVMAGLQRKPGVRLSVLVPNIKGLEAALPTKPDEVVVFGAASEAFSQRNINCGIEESIERFRPVVQAARAAGVKVRGAISCALGCPYQGEVSLDDVERVVRLMKDIGVQHVGIADTIGVGTARRAQAALERALKHYPLHEVSGHFHDTYGQALANIYACLEMGVHVFDTSVAGLGGCPYAKGATGNVASEDVVFMLNGLGIETGIDLNALVDAGAFISGVLGRAPVSRAGKALLAKREKASV